MKRLKYPSGFFRKKPCRTCGTAFEPTAPSNHYCSDPCRPTRKDIYLRRVYGITNEDLERLKAEQDSKCKICGSPGFTICQNNATEKLAVDHCHKTGIVRGLLCHNCNRALGLLQDDPEIILKAAQYVQSFL